MSDSKEPKYISVTDFRNASIVRRCEDKGCHSYHTWVVLSRGGKWEADQIVKAMNTLEVSDV